jgi:hypothetical protein
MNKSQKLEFQQQIEGYLEENHVYDLFESLMMNLIKDKPIDPIQYLVQKLETPQRKN